MLLEAIEGFYKTLENNLGDRSKTVGSSEIGLCARQTFWVKNQNTKKGVDIDDDFIHDFGARIRGIVMEKHFMVPAMRHKYGDGFLYAGDEQRKLTKGYLSSTPDGLLINQPYDALRNLGVKDIKSNCITVEFKSIDPRTNLVEAKEQHVYQCNTQLGLFRELTPYKPLYGALTYVDASFWSEVDEFPIQYNDDMYKAAHERAEEIITAKHGGQLLPEGWISGGKECSFCPYVKACGVERRGVPKGQKNASPQFAAEMEDTAKAYNTIKLSVKAKEETLRTMEVQIKNRLREKGVRRIPGIVTWYDIAAPVRYKNKEIRQAYVELGGDLEEFTGVGEPSDRLVIAATPAASRVVKQAKRTSAKAKTGKVKAKATSKPETGKVKHGKEIRSSKRATGNRKSDNRKSNGTRRK